MVDLVREFHHVEIDLARLPRRPRSTTVVPADTVGVFQVESRAQMNTLPRVQPRCFYDLAIEVALIRPGPSRATPSTLHPAAQPDRAVTYLHPLLQPPWSGRSGALFQEQLDAEFPSMWPGSHPTEADELRQA